MTALNSSHWEQALWIKADRQVWSSSVGKLYCDITVLSLRLFRPDESSNRGDQPVFREDGPGPLGALVKVLGVVSMPVYTAIIPGLTTRYLLYPLPTAGWPRVVKLEKRGGYPRQKKSYLLQSKRQSKRFWNLSYRILTFCTVSIEYNPLESNRTGLKIW